MDIEDYLMILAEERGDLYSWCLTLSYIYQRKLWHNLSLKLDRLVYDDRFQIGDALIKLYKNFVVHFEEKISPFKLAEFVVAVSNQYKDKEHSIIFLEGIVEKMMARENASRLVEMRVKDSIVYLKMQMGLYHLYKGCANRCKSLLEEAESIFENMTCIDPFVHGSFFWVSSQFHKTRKDFAEFYKSTILYLGYTSVESYSDSFKEGLALDISVAALVEETIYNFGELLTHPVVKSLKGTTMECFYHVLEAFNSGDLVRYQKLCQVHGATIHAQPALVENEKRLLLKIRILCLMDIIFRRPAKDRTIPLSIIAEHTNLTVEDVECLVMKSLSLHLIEGVIDGVEGTVHVSWVRPRVLVISDVPMLRDRLDSWIVKTHTALTSIKAEDH